MTPTLPPTPMTPTGHRPARPVLPDLPPGAYATPDPRRPDVLTLWHVTTGQLRPWPPRQRWAPAPPPPPPGLLPRERADWRESWYAAHYWPWKRRVVEAIQADPAAATAAFNRAVPDAEHPRHHERNEAVAVQQREERRKETRRRLTAAQERRILMAAVLTASGRSYRDTAHILDCSPSSAWRYARQGEALFTRRHGPHALASAADSVIRIEAGLPPQTRGRR
ncbi:hypothetical protein [Streptomyces erythrochromogenes]|uniref:hypothetical protein n=1 Tax=Streptomyces erythrochromogenes TaxID=285574 RepID=UPI00386EA282|nr:hypothetical protein OG364_29535 [Streptomyces erythrochromogenes]